jgi:hypothetical protein
MPGGGAADQFSAGLLSAAGEEADDDMSRIAETCAPGAGCVAAAAAESRLFGMHANTVPERPLEGATEIA